jgi:hypothetical protein
MRVLYRSIFGLVILFAAIASIAQRRDNPDSIVLNRAQLVSQTDRIEVYRDGLMGSDPNSTSPDGHRALGA